ncbi:hypothetical protein A4249_15780 [Brevundimonas sp. GW460-12-10-14-LB2]|nr:hypothetical protein A4249_15780 [Brevundimonas sp. GW460-12-10-14-LB2]
MWRLWSLIGETARQLAAADCAGFAPCRSEPFVDAIDRQPRQIGDGLGGVTLSQKAKQVLFLSGETIEI